LILDFFKKKKLKPTESGNLNFNDIFHYDLSDVELSDTIESLSGFAGSKKLFLGRFNSDNIFSIMERVGLIRYLKSIGFDNLIVDVDFDENEISYFKLYWDEKIPSKQLIDLRVSETLFLPDELYCNKKADTIPYSLIVIEWLSSRNPLKQFDSSKPQLPGQTYPGLGVLSYCFEMFYIISKLVFKDGFMDVPDHMYGAIMYSKKYKFFDPVHEGILRAVIRDLRRYSLADISWGVITETIIDVTTGKPAVYAPSEQIYFVSGRMKKYFESKKYKSVFLNYYKKKKFYFDYDEMVKRRDQILNTKRIEDL